MWQILVLQAILASTYTASKMVVGVSEPFFALAVRMLGAAALFLGWYAYSKKEDFSITPYSLLHIALYGTFSMFLGYGLDFVGLQYMHSVKMVLIYNVAPFFAAMLSYFYFGEKLTKRKTIGMVIGFASLLPTLLVYQDTTVAGYGDFLFLSLPEIAILLSVLFYAWGLMHMRMALKNYNVPSTLLNGGGMLCAGILSAITVPFVTSGQLVYDVPRFIGCSAYIIIFSNVICFSAYAHLLKRFSVTLITFSDFIATLFTFLFGSLILGEPLHWYIFISAAGVFAGLCLFYFEELKEEVLA
jgi:drug/metabolite transporter (DMT)-like permease